MHIILAVVGVPLLVAAFAALLILPWPLGAIFAAGCLSGVLLLLLIALVWFVATGGPR